MYDFHIILDFEMNPVPKKLKYRRTCKYFRAEIIEIGAVKLDADFNIVDRWRSYVRPEINPEVMPEITELTGIHTEAVSSAPCLADALADFTEWIGDGWNRIYSWSDNDLLQLMDECTEKGLDFPDNMYRWMDLQKVYPRMLNIFSVKHMALRDAVCAASIPYNPDLAHSALYDAELTTQLLIPLLNGSYRSRVQKNRRIFTKTVEHSTHTIGEACGPLADLLKQLQEKEAG